MSDMPQDFLEINLILLRGKHVREERREIMNWRWRHVRSLNIDLMIALTI